MQQVRPEALWEQLQDRSSYRCWFAPPAGPDGHRVISATIRIIEMQRFKVISDSLGRPDYLVFANVEFSPQLGIRSRVSGSTALVSDAERVHQ